MAGPVSQPIKNYMGQTSQIYYQDNRIFFITLLTNIIRITNYNVGPLLVMEAQEFHQFIMLLTN
jgi:hypothetical protein